MKRLVSCLFTLVFAATLAATSGCKSRPAPTEQAPPIADAATRAADENVKCEAQGDFASCVVPKSTLQEYSPYVEQDFPNRVYWGDTHNHTSFSFDAGFGNPLGPEIAYRFARGEEVTSSQGVRAKLRRPLDFLVVSDHAEFIGLPDLLRTNDPELLKNATAARWAKMLHAGGEEGTKAAIEAVLAIFQRNEVFKDPKVTRSIWEK